jgi:hypothetical protein
MKKAKSVLGTVVAVIITAAIYILGGGTLLYNLILIIQGDEGFHPIWGMVFFMVIVVLPIIVAVNIIKQVVEDNKAKKNPEYAQAKKEKVRKEDKERMKSYRESDDPNVRAYAEIFGAFYESEESKTDDEKTTRT